MLPHLNPELHLFLLLPEDTEGPAPTTETAEHPHPPPLLQEDETASSSEATTVSAALETAFPYQWQEGACTPLPSSDPNPVSLQDGLGVSTQFLAHPTPCTLAGERVGLLHTCVWFARHHGGGGCQCLHTHACPV